MQSGNERLFIDLEIHSVARLLDEGGLPLPGSRIDPVVAHAIRAQVEAAAKGSRGRGFVIFTPR
jgi:hypothetical protein